MSTQALGANRSAIASRAARDEAALTVRARSTCTGAHIHVGSLRMQRGELPRFAERYHKREDVSMLAGLTASAVNDIQGTLAPQLGLRVRSVVATASAAYDFGPDEIGLDVLIESPDPEPAVRQLVEMWQQMFAAMQVPAAASLQVTTRVIDWYATN